MFPFNFRVHSHGPVGATRSCRTSAGGWPVRSMGVVGGRTTPLDTSLAQGGAQHASPPLRFANGLTVRSKAARHGRKLTPSTHRSASEGPYRHPYHSQRSCKPGDRLGPGRAMGSDLTIFLPFVTTRSTDLDHVWRLGGKGKVLVIWHAGTYATAGSPIYTLS